MTVSMILLKWVSNCPSRLPYDSGVASKIKRILGNVTERSNHILRSADSSSIVLLCNGTRLLLPYKKITNMCFYLVPFFLPRCPANSVIIPFRLFLQCWTLLFIYNNNKKFSGIMNKTRKEILFKKYFLKSNNIKKINRAILNIWLVTV